jgi:hypothetical protein
MGKKLNHIGGPANFDSLSEITSGSLSHNDPSFYTKDVILSRSMSIKACCNKYILYFVYFCSQFDTISSGQKIKEYE